jgi:hypothetical protein
MPSGRGPRGRRRGHSRGTQRALAPLDLHRARADHDLRPVGRVPEAGGGGRAPIGPAVGGGAGRVGGRLPGRRDGHAAERDHTGQNVERPSAGRPTLAPQALKSNPPGTPTDKHPPQPLPEPRTQRAQPRRSTRRRPAPPGAGAATDAARRPRISRPPLRRHKTRAKALTPDARLSSRPAPRSGGAQIGTSRPAGAAGRQGRGSDLGGAGSERSTPNHFSSTPPVRSRWTCLTSVYSSRP